VYAPAAGGSYQGRAHVDGLPDIHGHLSLWVTDDGGEFFGGDEVTVGGRQCHVRISFADNIYADVVVAPEGTMTRAVRIRRGGGFSAVLHQNARRVTVRGAFSRTGRTVSGTIVAGVPRTARGRRRAGAHCGGRVTIRFTARLRGRPFRRPSGKWRDCSPTNRDARRGPKVVAADHGLGCTAAHEAARVLLRRGGRCAGDPGTVCPLTSAARCTTVRGGRRDPAAQVSCAAPGRPDATAELTVRRLCQGSQRDLTGTVTWASNLGCEEARTVAREWWTGQSCGEDVAGCPPPGFRCRTILADPEFFSLTAMCRDAGDPYRTVVAQHHLT
jgi:hypothetical protein